MDESFDYVRRIIPATECTFLVPAASGCPTATTFLNRTSGLNTTHITAYTNLICGLVADGVFTKFDALYIFATQDATTANLNLISTNFGITPVANGGAGPVFTADSGYQNADSQGYLDTGFNPSTAGSPQYTQNSAHLSFWSKTNVNEGNAIMGQGGLGNNLFLFTDAKFYSRINDNVEAGGEPVATDAGHFIGNRTSSSAIESFAQGSSIGAQASTSKAVVNANYTILANGIPVGNGNIANICCSASIGQGLTSTDASNFYARLRTYMTAVGVP